VRSGAEPAALELRSEAGAHVVLLQGEPIRERIVQRGPFVMNTCEELAAVAAAHEAGELGSID
jgi:redox-sensitive bicupin YhaK (pirin superfamily)